MPVKHGEERALHGKQTISALKTFLSFFSSVPEDTIGLRGERGKVRRCSAVSDGVAFVPLCRRMG